MRELPNGRFAVRISVRSSQMHVGTFDTLQAATIARDAAKQSAVKTAAEAMKARATTAAATETETAAPTGRSRARHVFDRTIGGKQIYEVSWIANGKRVNGGRFKTLDRAIARRDELKKSTASATPPPSNEYGVRARFMMKSGATRFVARNPRKQNAHIGVFATIEEARAAVASELAHADGPASS